MSAELRKRKVLVESSPDPSSVSIAKYIRENFLHSDYENGLIDNGSMVLFRLEELHINHDRIEIDLRKIGIEPDMFVFLSKHSSAAGISSLTVHPMGNFGSADIGGLPGTLAQSEPTCMTSALRFLSEAGVDGFDVSYEATHHGPFTEVPSFFIEIGTKESDWSNPLALEAVSKAAVECSRNDTRCFLGVGGGHYSPKQTAYALENGVSVGHIISKHVHNILTDDLIDQAIERTPGFTGFIMDRKGTRGPVREKIRSKADLLGCELIIL